VVMVRRETEREIVGFSLLDAAVGPGLWRKTKSGGLANEGKGRTLVCDFESKGEGMSVVHVEHSVGVPGRKKVRSGHNVSPTAEPGGFCVQHRERVLSPFWRSPLLWEDP